MLGLHCCAHAFSSCDGQASHCGGFSCCGERVLGARAQQLGFLGSRAQAQELWPTGLVALRHVGSFQTRDQTHPPALLVGVLSHV